METPHPATPDPKAKIFLSCAEEDEEDANELESQLNTHFEVFYWKRPRQRGGVFVGEIEDAIKSANMFLAVLSPNYLNSYWCNHERILALQREAEIKEQDPDATLIYVANVAAMRPADAGFLSSYDWLEMTSPEKKKKALADLRELSSARLRAPSASVRDTVGPQSLPPDPEQQVEPMTTTPGEEFAFRNRDDELNQVLNGLTNSAGEHCWCVVAPPQLGKTWFLEHVSAHPRLTQTVPWTVRLVNLRSPHTEVPEDAGALLSLLFGSEYAVDGSHDPVTIAEQIGESGRPHLCLIDGAELLSRETAGALRAYISEIRNHLEVIGDINLRLAFIAASRRDDGWKGVIPLRLSSLPLTEFQTYVVQKALGDLANEMGRSFSQDYLRQNALRVHRVTEGLPALLVKCLQWIRKAQWVRLERLEGPEWFREFVVPYIDRELLSSTSLLPHGHGKRREARVALVDTYRVLTPYRLFTRSHLREHFDTNDEFKAALTAASWSPDDLWLAISETTLLRRVPNEPWYVIHAAIRRLLFRYYYPSQEERATAHDAALHFVNGWSSQQTGSDQVVGLVECLWHEASALRLRNSPEMEQRLTESARKLSGNLRPSDSLALDDLRGYAADRMIGDAELEEVIGNDDGLLPRLVEIVLNPEVSLRD